MTTPDPTATPPAEEPPKREVPFDKEDLTYGPDDVVENSDADPDVQSDPAKDDGSSSDWADEGGATDEGPAAVSR
ncbi:MULTISPECIES: hypothetical protein [unclassified Nocardioides]|uniref:hypothetical protein n=1 Tax=unclassified Nocardioides TaxID=2615069 RepID=UPI0006F4A261|nr:MULTISPECIES: hypothetical protein [unclassified Nocardioides]KRA38908.1 hypothetical protein ASD81_10060 [Nocardioides sp. Root614]KRA92868.1 hypothetical protein ASD84_10325 [Nocardioides sp. Root682]